MNLAALVQSQNLATLLQALGSTTELAPGTTVEARLLSLGADGTATAQIGESAITLLLAGPEAKQAALAPGATLLLRIDAGEEPGAPARATLVEIRPPGPGTTAPAQRGITTVPAQRGIAADGSAAVASPAGQPAASRNAAPAGPSALTLDAQPLRPASIAQPAAPQATQPSPRVAAGPLLGPALANQAGLAPLFANLRSLAQGSVALIVPKPLLALADQILTQAIAVEAKPLTPEALKQAVQRSGLFLEAHQAAVAPSGQADLKASLVALRGTLQPLIEALGGRPASERRPDIAKEPATAAGLLDPSPARPAPPRRDGPLALQPIEQPTIAPGEKPLVVAETLLEQTDAALDRITLSQYASLPLDAARSDTSQSQRWLTEVPLAFQSGTAILPLQIEKEPPRRGPSGVEAPLWRIRFALDVEPMGPLQGIVTLQGRSVGVTLWAEREDTSRLLRGAAPGLEQALVDADFENGAIDVHTGQPRTMQPTAGQFLDRMS